MKTDVEVLAACKDADPRLFFPADEERPSRRDRRERRAKRICAPCEARAACLDYALAHDERHGIWGGLNPDERASMHRSQMRQRVPAPPPRKPVTEKRCPSCRHVKPASEYGRDQSRVDGLYSACKTCTNAREQRRRDERKAKAS